jgi:hypothetical protein
VQTFVRPKGIDLPTTPVIVDALERLATATRPRVRRQVTSYPLAVVLWIGGVFAYYPQRVWNLLRKQWRIAEKRTHHMRKRLRRIHLPRVETQDGPDVPRATTGSERPERDVDGQRKAG